MKGTIFGGDSLSIVGFELTEAFLEVHKRLSTHLDDSFAAEFLLILESLS